MGFRRGCGTKNTETCPNSLIQHIPLEIFAEVLADLLESLILPPAIRPSPKRRHKEASNSTDYWPYLVLAWVV